MGTESVRDLDLNRRSREVCRTPAAMMPAVSGNRASDTVRGLFTEYEKAFAAFDFEKDKELFADTFIPAGRRGVIAQSRSEFPEMAHQTALFCKSAGWTSVKIIFLQETPVSNEYSLIRARRGATFRKSGDRLIEFDVSCLVQTSRPEPRTILYFAHRDEENAMRDLGTHQKAGGQAEL